MRKTFSFLMMATLFACIVAIVATCGQRPTEAQSSQRGMRLDDGEGIRVWTDPDTNCQYLLYYGNAITPRLQGGGPICRA